MTNTLAINGGPRLIEDAFPKWPIHDVAEREALSRVLDSGEWGATKGDEVPAFEQAFSEANGAKFGAAANSGTTALGLALKAAGVEPGDEVIVPAYTFIASATSILDALAKPVFVDIDPMKFNIDPTLVEAAITSRTKAIMPVHFAGRPADMDALGAIAAKHGLVIVEDAAQAWGSVYRGANVGSIGAAGCFSFQSSKNITAGEGGIILSNDKEVADLARSLGNCGRTADGLWYAHYRHGGNYRMTAFQAAVLGEQLRRYPEHHERREHAAARLRERVESLDGFSNLAPLDEGSRSSCHLFIYRIDIDAWEGATKDTIVKALNAEGVPAHPGYTLPAHKQPLFVEGLYGPGGGVTACFDGGAPDYASVSLPHSERACDTHALWASQNILLADDELLDRLGDGLEKVYRLRADLPKE